MGSDGGVSGCLRGRLADQEKGRERLINFDKPEIKRFSATPKTFLGKLALENQNSISLKACSSKVFQTLRFDNDT